MTIITVTAPAGRLTSTQRGALAPALTDAVLIPEVGQPSLAARAGFQVHFVELSPEHMAIGGALLSQQATVPDPITIDVCVMDAAWPKSLRRTVIENVLAALTQVCGTARPSPAWWVNFRVVDEGSWGSRGGVLSILDLLDSGAFTPERVREIRAAVAAGEAGA